MIAKRYILSALWLIALTLGVYLSLDLKNESQREAGIKEFYPEALIEELSLEASELFIQFEGVDFNSEQTNRAYKLKKKRWYLSKFDSTGARFWNSNKIGLDSSLFAQQAFPLYYSFGDDFYLVFKGQGGVFLSHRLANDGKLSQKFVLRYPDLRNYKLQRENEPSISALGGLNLTYERSGESYSWLVLSLLFLSLLALFFVYYKNEKMVMAIVVTIVLLALDLTLYFGHFEALSNHSLYQPELYASSNFLGSLGALINHLLVAIPVVFLFRLLLERLSFPFWLRFISFVLAYFIADLFLDLVKGLVLDSNISFNYEQLYGINVYTFLAVTAIGLCFFLLWAYLIQIAAMDKKDHRYHWWSLSLAAMVFVVFQMVDAGRSFSSLILVIITVLSAAFLYQYWNGNRLKVISLYFLAILLTTIIVQTNQLQREQRYLSLYATKLVASQDIRAEYILKSLEDRLAEEFLVPEDYDNFYIRKDVVENRIKRLYFSNYLEKYELRMMSFDSLGKNINDNTLYAFDILDKIYNQNTKRTLSNYFYQINDPSLISGYIAKYENCDIDGHYGTTFILLQPRLIQSDFLYPEAFANQQKRELVNISEYSYGIYFKQKLISQKGSYAYSLSHYPEVPKKKFGRQFGEYYHFHYTELEPFNVVLSKKYNALSAWLSTFTFSFIFMLPIAILLLLLSAVYEPQNNFLLDLRGRFLSTRIQASLTLILLVGLLLSVYIIISYIRANYKDNLENQLLNTVKNIGAQFQNQVDLEQKLASEEERMLMINEESSDFKVDLNLYDAQGYLLSTTKSYLIKEEILGSLMNPNAYERMKGNDFSQLLLQEELEGTEYLSAYVPLFDGKNAVIAYLNVPYFAKNEQLNKQISTVLVNVVNIYFLLLLGGILIALFISKRISKPLLLIQQRFAETGLGIENELITYTRDDEIGSLVKQYNKMVLELEESASRLAATEREGAWREMAKQVAHEIKNPLTPMKLSIQHLQRAYERGGDNLDELFKRTSKLLIDQIDSLSRMASEFSSFAKMPEGNYEIFDLSEALQQTVDLFTRDQKVEIHSRIQDEAWVHADPEQIKRAFNNLIKNAIQSIPEDVRGKIEISLHNLEHQVVVKVKDNGKGISPDLGKKIFEPNFSTKTSGMGMGLAISKKIVETAKGSLDYETELGIGTVFILRLPLYNEN